MKREIRRGKLIVYFLLSLTTVLFLFLVIDQIGILFLRFRWINQLYIRNNDEYFISSIFQFKPSYYECTGFCTCADREISNSLHTFRHSLVYVVLALTSSVAIHLSQSHFESECKEKLMDSSSSSCTHVLSEIESCKKKEELNNDDVISRIEEWGVFSSSSGRVELNCEGNCLLYDLEPHQTSSNEEFELVKSRLMEIEQNNFLCSDVSVLDSYSFTKETLIETAIEYEKESSGGIHFETPERIAEIQFMVDILHEECVKQSEIKIDNNNNNLMSFCTGYNSKKGKDVLIGVDIPENPSVKCYRKKI